MVLTDEQKKYFNEFRGKYAEEENSSLVKLTELRKAGIDIDSPEVFLNLLEYSVEVYGWSFDDRVLERLNEEYCEIADKLGGKNGFKDEFAFLDKRYSRLIRYIDKSRGVEDKYQENIDEEDNRYFDEEDSATILERGRKMIESCFIDED